MSDWNSSELERIDWNEFGKSGDHIVPHQGGELGVDSLALYDYYMKPRHPVENDVVKIMYSTGSAISTGLWGEEDPSLSTMENGDTSIVDGSKSCASNVLVPALPDSEHGAIPTLPSEAKISSCFVTDHCRNTNINKFNSKEPVFEASFSTNDSKSCLSSLNYVSQDVSELFFLENEQKDRQIDLVYYDWPDIDNFEDIDKMFRNWDCTFGQGHAGTTDELSWFSSSSNAIYASEIAFEPGLQPSTSELGALDGQEGHCVNANIQHKNVPAGAELCSSGNESYDIWLDTESQDKGKFVAKEVCAGGDKITTLPLAHISKENGLDGYSTSNMTESQPSLAEKGRKRSTDRMLLDSDVTATQMGSNHIVNHQTQCFERRPDQFCMAQSMTREENIENVHQRQQVSAKMRMEHPQQQSAFRSKTLAWKKQPETRGGIEQGVVGLELPIAEMNSSVTQERSWRTSVASDDISLKANSFLQLQDLMHQLDVKTKLCMRDGLYRLASSARQRNGFDHTNNCIEAKIELLGFQGTEASKSLDPMDAETNTNPIDRTVAQLLFHKPSEDAQMSLDTATSFGSHVINE